MEGYGREAREDVGVDAVSSASLRIFLVPVLPIPKLEDHRFSTVLDCWQSLAMPNTIWANCFVNLDVSGPSQVDSSHSRGNHGAVNFLSLFLHLARDHGSAGEFASRG